MAIRAAVGFAPIAAVYGWTSLAAVLRGNPLPLVGFTPENTWGINVWVFLSDHFGVAPFVAKLVSSGLAAVVAVAVLVAFVVRGLPGSAERLAALSAAVLLWAYSLFYHVDPEYFIIVVPVLLLILRDKISLGVTSLVLASPWAVNFYLEFAMRCNRAKGHQGSWYL